MALPTNIADTRALLESGAYIADDALVTLLHLSLTLGRPLLLEGEAGVGKTELASVLAAQLDRPLIRLQCHEGVDASSAVYEWNYAAQMIEIRLAEKREDVDHDALAEDVFSERFLIKRALLKALEPGLGASPVLLIDEVDRADPPFEAYLLEILSDFQVTIPETGVVKATERPIVIITSNRTREIHDALKRRCFYRYIGYPEAEQEKAIICARLPGVEKKISDGIVEAIENLRKRDLATVPGLRARMEWAGAIIALDKVELDPATVRARIQHEVEQHQRMAAARDAAAKAGMRPPEAVR
jgi:MoxR-like ATPase